MSVTISPRLTSKQNAEFNAFINKYLTNWDLHIKELSKQASYSHIPIKNLFSDREYRAI